MAELLVPLPGVLVTRIGYHRKSDDSVSSSVWVPGSARRSFVEEIMESEDIDKAWFRTRNDFSSDGWGPAEYFKRTE